MMVMMIAITPSLNASIRPVPTLTPRCVRRRCRRRRDRPL
jgi:hypothetical protein